MKRHVVLFALALGACTTDEVSFTVPDVPLDGSAKPDVSVSADGAVDGNDEPTSPERDATIAPDAVDMSEPRDAGGDASSNPGVQDAGREGAAGSPGDARDEKGNGGGNPFADATADAPSGPLFDPCAANPRLGFDPSSTSLAICCAGVGPAHCVPNVEVAGGLADQLSSCDNVSVCMPDAIIRGGGQYHPASCSSVILGTLAVQGVCISRCIGLVQNNPNAAFLQRGDCGEGDLCIPCVNPLDNTPTGACNLTALLCPASTSDAGVDAFDGPADTGAPMPDVSVDAVSTDAQGATDARADAVEAGALCPYQGPPLIDPALFPACSPACGGAHCVPQAAVPASAASLLAACTSTGGAPGLCAPDAVIASAGNFVPRSCTSVAGAEGRCLSSCVPAVAARGNLLPTSVCDPGERCVPCFDPTSANPTQPTGACSLACDAPRMPPVSLTCPWTGPPVLDPVTFPACAPACGGAHCLPTALVPDNLRSQLSACPGGFCAPDTVIAGAGNAVPPTCSPFADTTASGRCLSSCLPSVAAQPSLEQSTCALGSKCVPCNDPFNGASTGACSTASCDAPPATPFLFTACCPSAGGFDGRCVPRSQIPDAQEANLLATGCAGASFCVPNDLLPGAPAPAACSASFVVSPLLPPVPYTGRCLSSCLNLGVFAAAPRGDCSINHVCMPCSIVPTAPGCQ